MGLKLEVRKEYATEDGRIVKFNDTDGNGCFTCDHDDRDLRFQVWNEDGSVWKMRSGEEKHRIIAPWPTEPTGPVRTVTRTTREIVPGVYDGLDVGQAVDGHVFIAMGIHRVDAEAIDALIAHLTVIRDALRSSDADHP